VIRNGPIIPAKTKREEDVGVDHSGFMPVSLMTVAYLPLHEGCEILDVHRVHVGAHVRELPSGAAAVRLTEEIATSLTLPAATWGAAAGKPGK
jgi:hypothetical protein